MMGLSSHTAQWTEQRTQRKRGGFGNKEWSSMCVIAVPADKIKRKRIVSLIIHENYKEKT